MHRVTAPEPGSAAAASARLSLPFFSGPHNDAVISTLPTCVVDGKPTKLAEPITALAHLLKKITATQLEE